LERFWKKAFQRRDKKMAKKNGDYFGVGIYDYEKNTGMNLKNIIITDWR